MLKSSFNQLNRNYLDHPSSNNTKAKFATRMNPNFESSESIHNRQVIASRQGAKLNPNAKNDPHDTGTIVEQIVELSPQERLDPIKQYNLC